MAFLEGIGMSFSKHSAVISAFDQEFANTGQVPVEYHRYLIAAEQIRLQGDYDPHSTLTTAQITEQILRAEAFLVFTETTLGSE